MTSVLSQKARQGTSTRDSGECTYTQCVFGSRFNLSNIKSHNMKEEWGMENESRKGNKDKKKKTKEKKRK
jgi:hypothetical protein